MPPRWLNSLHIAVILLFTLVVDCPSEQNYSTWSCPWTRRCMLFGEPATSASFCGTRVLTERTILTRLHRLIRIWWTVYTYTRFFGNLIKIEDRVFWDGRDKTGTFGNPSYKAKKKGWCRCSSAQPCSVDSSRVPTAYWTKNHQTFSSYAGMQRPLPPNTLRWYRRSFQFLHPWLSFFRIQSRTPEILKKCSAHTSYVKVA